MRILLNRFKLIIDVIIEIVETFPIRKVNNAVTGNECVRNIYTLRFRNEKHFYQGAFLKGV